MACPRHVTADFLFPFFQAMLRSFPSHLCHSRLLSRFGVSRFLFRSFCLRFHLIRSVVTIERAVSAAAVAIDTSISLRMLRQVAMLLLVAAARAIYPDDHWNYSTQLTEDTFDGFIETNIASGKTVFVRWIASP